VPGDPIIFVRARNGSRYEIWNSEDLWIFHQKLSRPQKKANDPQVENHWFEDLVWRFVFDIWL